MEIRKGFASDNNSGVHPDIMQAMADANRGHVSAYGNDPYTQRAKEKFYGHFGDDTDIYFTYNGTGANVLALKTLTDSWHSIICAESAHINEDECGAPEKITGCKLIPVKTSNGKLTVPQIAEYLVWLGDEHRSQPRMVSITQSTEFGTVYSLEEIKAICDFCHASGLLVHMDGARISNAAVSLGLPFRAFTRDAGIDVLSFGGTKNGMMFGEAVLFFNRELSRNAKYYRKQNMQLHSKMRFIAAQFDAFLGNDCWKKNAIQANNMAALLYREVSAIPSVKVVHSVDANGVFAIIPVEYTAELQKLFYFYVFNEHTNMVRWMCSFDTTEDDVLRFSNVIRSLNS